VESFATAQQVFAAGLVFARVAAILMVLPGIGEQAVPPRARLALSLLIALCVFPVAAPYLPALPETNAGLVGYLIREILIGLMIGSILRMLFGSLAVAGEIVSLQTTLGFAQTSNPMEAKPTGSLGTFLTLLGVTLVFATNLHHLFIAAIFDSYVMFAPGGDLPIEDATSLAIRTAADSFKLGVQMAAPVMVFAIVFNIASGLVGRLMPQFQIYFVASPLSVIFGLSIFALSLGTIGMVWIARYRELTLNFTDGF
jgi:flagellar biosynthetic protein FliR